MSLVTQKSKRILLLKLILWATLVFGLASCTSHKLLKLCNLSVYIPGNYLNERKTPVAKASPGYFLVTSLNNKKGLEQYSSRLIDNNGLVIHRWVFERRPFYAKLNKNGDLFVSFITKDAEGLPSPGGTELLEAYSWSGQKLWSYSNSLMHHDFTLMPNGNIAILQWKKMQKKYRKILAKRVFPKRLPKTIWTDSIVEIDRRGKKIWEWDTSEVLVFDQGEKTIATDWSHANSLNYEQANPFGENSVFLVSLRNLNRSLAVEKLGKKILWDSKKLTSTQHDVSLVDKKNILLFDNRFNSSQSRVILIDPKTNRILRVIDGGNDFFSKFQFNASIVSGAQKLENGNILVSNGVLGHVFEVNNENTKVFEFFNNREKPGQEIWPYDGFFKVKKYSKNYFSDQVQSKLVICQ